MQLRILPIWIGNIRKNLPVYSARKRFILPPIINKIKKTGPHNCLLPEFTNEIQIVQKSGSDKNKMHESRNTLIIIPAAVSKKSIFQDTLRAEGVRYKYLKIKIYNPIL